MERPSILKESAEITKDNLVGDKYIIATEDIHEEQVYEHNKLNELIQYIIEELKLTDDIMISYVDREWLEDSISNTRNELR